jgi:endoglucanase
VIVLALGPGAASSVAGVANAGLPGAPRSNPLAGMRWGAWRPDTTNPGVDTVGAYYHRTRHGADRAALNKVLSRPRFRWLGPWIADGSAGQVARSYIQDITHGNSRVGTSFAVFRLNPWEGSACRSLPSAGQRTSYRSWIRHFAVGIGRSRVAIALQPDMPFMFCLPHRSHLDYGLIRYAAKVLTRLPHTTVYIDAGSADWPYQAPGRTADMLKLAGVRSVRGFALDITHYGAAKWQVARGKALVKALAHRGIPHKHFIVNTVASGHPFHGPLAHHKLCASRHSHRCVAIGPKPTTHTRSPDDGNLWIGRPWYDASRSFGGVLRMIRTSPFL